MQAHHIILQRLLGLAAEKAGFGTATVIRWNVPKKSSKTTKRQAFSKGDFNKLRQACADSDSVVGDLVMLAGYTGARIEELCSLKLTEVGPDRFTIKDAKTDAGQREIPIHSKIAGLVDDLSKNSTDGYLFSDLTSSKYGNRSNAIGKCKTPQTLVMNE